MGSGSAHERAVGSSLTVAGLFAGIGGIEVGFHEAGHRTLLLCENDPAANAVLDAHFPGVARHDDVRTLDALPAVDVVAAGFPCQDLSQAGRTAGIRGERSGLVEHVFALLDRAEHEPTWVVLENVPFMLQLDRGGAMTYLTHELGRRGYLWAYRVVDTRATGLPQRRQRVLLVASRTADPRPVLFAQDAGAIERPFVDAAACGFYWTEGLTGLGWAIDAIPTLKGGSALGIPSPPAIWLRASDEIVTPDLRDAERLQGFPADWTLPAVAEGSTRRGPRWRLVGNAVSVPVARWLGERLTTSDAWEGERMPCRRPGGWPPAAWGQGDEAYAVAVSTWPVHSAYQPLADFLAFAPSPLSPRATAGFLGRTRRASLRFEPQFIAAIERHLDAVAPVAA
jgi:DNA (cytosine-5)-methyltransferase 1